MTATPTVAGVELGGTKCVCTLAAGPRAVLAQETVPTTRPEQTLDAISRILDAWRGRFAALGIASFGPIELDPDAAQWGYITSTPKPGWRNANVARRLAEPFGIRPAFDTDVNAAASAEMAWGSGCGLDDFAYVTVGTGIGVGLIVNGRPTRGYQHCELGHVRIARLPGDDWPGTCSYHGPCVEGLASGTAIRARTGSDPAALPDDDPVWETVAFALAQLCHAIVCAAAPQRIAIGGGVSTARPQLLPRTERLLRDSLAGYLTLPDQPFLVPPGLGAAAGPLGPVALALAALDTRA